MKLHIFRNYTVEPLFRHFNNVTFSGYGTTEDQNETANAYIWFYSAPLNQSSEIFTMELESYLSKLDHIIAATPKEKNIICLTIEELFPFQFVNDDFNVKRSIYNYNLQLFERTKKHANLKVLDFRNFVQNYSLDQLIDWKYYYLTETIINPKLADNFYTWLKNKLNALNGVRKKCLIVDLDNTLWGGVLGEDGINGIKLGGGYPGNAFKEFQKDIKKASNNGIIIAICSKNNEGDVLEFINKHQEQVLKIDDFSCVRINWTEKSKNIVSIANELNIGTDSIVFIDDNPVEQEFVKKVLPEVQVPVFPKNPYQLKKFFKDVYESYFQTYELTEEDKNKKMQYSSNIQRQLHRAGEESAESFISTLETEITIYKANEFNISRIAQMTQKTNQFNLTTKRYEVGDIKKLIDQGYLIYCAAVSDKFGDNGITALAIIQIDSLKETATIDSFLLSCRILGREIENCFLQFVLNSLFDLQIKKVRANYIRTIKNIQTENFYEKSGFSVANNDNTNKEYHIELVKKQDIKEYFKININYD